MTREDRALRRMRRDYDARLDVERALRFDGDPRWRSIRERWIDDTDPVQVAFFRLTVAVGVLALLVWGAVPFV